MATISEVLTEDERYIILDGLDALATHYRDEPEEIAKIHSLMDKIDPYFDEDNDDDDV
jgi:hypothetical protein